MMDKSKCNGCYNNDYNFGLGGSKECWSFKDAKLIKRLKIHVDMQPPYDKKSAKKYPNCYTEKRYVFVNPEVLDSKGYWR